MGDQISRRDALRVLGGGAFADPRDTEVLGGYPLGAGDLHGPGAAAGMATPLAVVQAGDADFFFLSSLDDRVRPKRIGYPDVACVGEMPYDALHEFIPMYHAGGGPRRRRYARFFQHPSAGARGDPMTASRRDFLHRAAAAAPGGRAAPVLGVRARTVRARTVRARTVRARAL